MKENALHIRIISPEGTLFEGEVTHATLPGTAGSFSVYPLHAPLISSLEKGAVRYWPNDHEERIDIESGFVEVKEDRITVCVERQTDQP